MFATRALHKVVKRSTGIVGLPLDPRARETLIELYTRTLQELKVGRTAGCAASCASARARGAARAQQIPEDAFYRKSVESFTSFRLKTVQENEDVRGLAAGAGIRRWPGLMVAAGPRHALPLQPAAIERIVGAGQLEEMIVQAKDELELIPKFAGATPLHSAAPAELSAARCPRARMRRMEAVGAVPGGRRRAV